MKRLVGLGLCGALAIAAVHAIGAADVAAPVIAPPSPLTTAVAAGKHWRLDTPNGAVHVWMPAGYHADGAATVVYVHGYYTDVDGAWREHQLPEQFALSGANAVFIACEAPAGNRQPVRWRSLSDLLRTVRAGIEEPLPTGPVVAMGHSGAFRTLIPWLDDPRLDWVVMVDAAYAEIDPFVDWVKASSVHHLYFIGDDTIEWTEEMLRQLPGAIVVDRFPAAGLPPEAESAPIVYVRSQYGHMRLVYGGVALPSVLRALPMPLLGDAPWSEPLGVLPPPDAAVDAGLDGDGGGALVDGDATR
ncbi:MAG: hypothetical protein K8W52_25190 [Deltaproteobacteria bacterium]|nr:hypothetical protein [Deltaproteobacteria bacterium]